MRPLDEMNHHPPEQGRLRYGMQVPTRDGKNLKPVAIPTWRLTSPDRDAIEQAAELWGGEARPWNEPKATIKSQWEVVTEAATVACWLVPGSLSQHREAWAGGALQRRCDGRSCSMYEKNGTAHGQPCWCAAQGLQIGDKGACGTKSRVTVILPQLRFGGVWRLDVGGEVFAHEAPGMIALIEQLQPQGLSSVELTLTQRSKVTQAGVQHYIVPTFTLGASPAQMLAGQAQVQLTGGARAELAPARSVPAHYEGDAAGIDDDGDDEIQDAVIVEFPQRSKPEPETDGWDTPPPNVKVRRNPDPGGPKWIRK